MMNIDFITATVLDGAFAAVAAIGFAIISNPPRKAILISAFLAAVGHGLRYFLMHAHLFTMDIATASFFAAVSIGLLAIPFAKAIHCPAEVFSFPSLLPMIPGMFAYKSILALTKFMQTKDETDSLRYLVDFCHNGSTTIFVLFALVVGAAVPVFIFHRQSFTATRENLTGWFGAGAFCVGMGSKLFPKDKVAAEDWGYVTKKCTEALEYIAEARK